MPKRDSRGRFLKKGSGSRSKGRSRKASTAIVVASPRTITRTRTIVRTPKRRGRSRHSGGGHTMTIGARAEHAGWGGVLGYLSKNNAATYEKIPEIGKAPREAVIAAVAHYFAPKNKHINRIATAAAVVAGYKLGLNDFKLSGDEY